MVKKIIVLVLTLTFMGSCSHFKKCGCGDKGHCSHEMKKDSADSKQDNECTDCKTK